MLSCGEEEELDGATWMLRPQPRCTLFHKVISPTFKVSFNSACDCLHGQDYLPFLAYGGTAGSDEKCLTTLPLARVWVAVHKGGCMPCIQRVFFACSHENMGHVATTMSLSQRHCWDGNIAGA
jgi:hypothetical protein